MTDFTNESLRSGFRLVMVSLFAVEVDFAHNDLVVEGVFCGSDGVIIVVVMVVDDEGIEI